MPASPPAAAEETTIMVAWPSIAATSVGRWLGTLFELGPRISVLGIPFKPGWSIALATLPVTVFLYFNKIVPRIPFVIFGISNPWCRRYRLTDERIVVEQPFDALSSKRANNAVQKSLALAEFDAAKLEQLDGYDWYRASDIVFTREGNEVLRLAAVPNAEAFRQTCVKTRQAVLGVAATKPIAAVTS